jgi:hypothetical protein
MTSAEAMANQLGRVTGTLSAFAAGSEFQLHYLRRIGFPTGSEVVDELAQELDELGPTLAFLSERGALTAAQSAAVEAFRSYVFGLPPSEVWDRERLSSQLWEEIRVRARDVLAKL